MAFCILRQQRSVHLLIPAGQAVTARNQGHRAEGLKASYTMLEIAFIMA
jgi:hypothetical protein